MTASQKQIVNSKNDLSDESLKPVGECANQLSPSFPDDSGIQRIGIAKDKFIYADDYDFDEANDEIAEMFGVN